MSTEIKPGQVWEYKRTSDTEPVTVTEVRDGTVAYVFAADQSDGDMSIVAFRKMRRLVTDAPPAPLDPKSVHVGDTVTVRFIETGDEIVTKAYQPDDITASGEYVYLLGWPLHRANGTFGLAFSHFEILAIEPAPEPEPEWLFEFKGEEGPEGDEHWARRFPSRADALRSMIESANLDELNDFEGAVSFSVYTDETGPAEIPDICAHGQTAEDLCNAMPAKVELDAMWTAWKSLTPAEQRGWLEGGVAKVPTPAKISGRPVVTRAQVFDILYPDGILPAEDMREGKIDALIALFGGAS